MASPMETRRVLLMIWLWGVLRASRLAVLRGRPWVKQMAVLLVVEKDEMWDSSLEWTKVRV